MELISTVFTVTKMVILLLDVVLVGTIAFLWTAVQPFRPNLFPRRAKERNATLSRSMLREQWDAIKAHLNENTPANRKLAIIEADKLVDHILKESGFGGEHMADRLERLAPHNLRSFDRLWRAHKVRNEIVHSMGYEVPEREAKQALDDYEEFLKEVRILY